MSREELRNIFGPIALYPDVLLAQMLTAATFPIDIVQADRWLQGNPDPSTILQQPWDPSVLSLCNYPSIIAQMSQDLDWTNAIGAAFINQQKEVMDVIQELRRNAQATGALQTTPQQSVVVEESTVRIVPAETQVVYVPQYDPQVVYVDDDDDDDAWGYAAASALSFGAGMALGSWLDLDCNWYGGCVGWCRPGYWGGYAHRGAVAWGNDWAAAVGPRRGFVAGENGGVAWGPRGGAAWSDGHGAAWRRGGASPMPAYTGRYRTAESRRNVGANRGYVNNSRNVNVNRNNLNIGNTGNINRAGNVGNRNTQINNRANFPQGQGNRAFGDRSTGFDANRQSQRGWNSRGTSYGQSGYRGGQTANRSNGSGYGSGQARSTGRSSSYGNRSSGRSSSAFGQGRSSSYTRQSSSRGRSSRGGGMSRGGGRRGGGGRRR